MDKFLIRVYCVFFLYALPLGLRLVAASERKTIGDEQKNIDHFRNTKLHEMTFLPSAKNTILNWVEDTSQEIKDQEFFPGEKPPY